MSRLVRESTCPWVELSVSRVVGSRVVRESSRPDTDHDTVYKCTVPKLAGEKTMP